MNKAKKLSRAFDAQKFATQTTATSTLTTEMKTFYEGTLIDNAEPNLVHNQFGDKYPIPKNGGKTIEFRKYDSLPKATTPLTEGVTPTGNSLTVTAITATVNQYGDYIQLSDMLELSAIDNNVVQSTKLLGSQSGRTIDTITRDILNGGTNVIYAPIIGKDASGKVTLTPVSSRGDITAAATLTPDLFFKASAQLKAFNTPKINRSYVAIIHPYAAYDLMRTKDWIDVHKYATPENIYEGEIGKIGNVRFVESTEAKITADGKSNCKVFSTLVLGAHAYGVTEITGGGLKHIIKQLGYGDDPLDQRSSVGWKATHVARRLVEQYMVRIESGSAYSDVASVN